MLELTLRYDSKFGRIFGMRDSEGVGVVRRNSFQHTILLGRNEDCDLRVGNNFLSRRQLKLTWDPNTKQPTVFIQNTSTTVIVQIGSVLLGQNDVTVLNDEDHITFPTLGLKLRVKINHLKEIKPTSEYRASFKVKMSPDKIVANPEHTSCADGRGELPAADKMET